METQMTDSKRVSQVERTIGDSAVDGLLAGVGAGFIMAVYLGVVGLVQGQPLGAMLGRFDPGPTASPLTGVLVHLAVSGVYGAIYGTGRRLTAGWPVLRSVPGWLLGAVYGAVLLAVAWGVILPGAASAALADVSLAHMAVAHLLYGLTLGILAKRS